LKQRIVYDFQSTISDLLIEKRLKPLREWANSVRTGRGTFLNRYKADYHSSRDARSDFDFEINLICSLWMLQLLQHMWTSWKGR